MASGPSNGHEFACHTGLTEVVLQLSRVVHDIEANGPQVSSVDERESRSWVLRRRRTGDAFIPA